MCTKSSLSSPVVFWRKETSLPITRCTWSRLRLEVASGCIGESGIMSTKDTVGEDRGLIINNGDQFRRNTSGQHRNRGREFPPRGERKNVPGHLCRRTMRKPLQPWAKGKNVQAHCPSNFHSFEHLSILRPHFGWSPSWSTPTTACVGRVLDPLDDHPSEAVAPLRQADRPRPMHPSTRIPHKFWGVASCSLV